MEIRFSESLGDDARELESVVLRAASLCAMPVYITWARRGRVRFTLPGASTDEHDLVIRELFKNDPGALVRTSRAVYEGRVDFESQLKARLATPKL